MSWADYVTSMETSQKIVGGALLGIDGTVWAKTESWGLSPEQAVTIASYIQSAEHCRNSGIQIGEKKFMVLHALDDELVYGKKGPSGFCAVKGPQVITIAESGEGISQQECNKVVQDMAAYLKESGY